MTLLVQIDSTAYNYVPHVKTYQVHYTADVTHKYVFDVLEKRFVSADSSASVVLITDNPVIV